MEKLITIFKESDRFVLIPALSSAISVLIIVVFFFLIQQSLPPKLPLFYSLPWGQAQLSGKYQFLLLPVILALATLVNILLAIQLHPVQLVLRRILTLNLVLINAVIFIASLKILTIFV